MSTNNEARRVLLFSSDGYLVGGYVGPGMRGKGVSAAVRGLSAGIEVLTVSRSALSSYPEFWITATRGTEGAGIGRERVDQRPTRY